MSRNIIATLWRSTGPGRKREPIWTRHYAWLDTAMPRAAQLAMNGGEVGDVVEFHSPLIGELHVATVRVIKPYQVSVSYSDLVNSSPKLKALLRGI